MYLQANFQVTFLSRSRLLYFLLCLSKLSIIRRVLFSIHGCPDEELHYPVSIIILSHSKIMAYFLVVSIKRRQGIRFTLAKKW